MNNARRRVPFALVLVFVLGLSLAGAPVRGEGDADAAKAAPATPPVSFAPAPRPPVDADQLAARMKTNLSLYKQIRDKALATYAKLHPTPSPFDDEARMTIRLGAYLFVWGDFYREGLWDAAVSHAMAVTSAGCDDPLIQALPIIHNLESKYSISEHQTLYLDHEGDQLAASNYPACFKFWYDSSEAQSVVALKLHHDLNDPKAQAVLPAVLEKAANHYEELIKEHVDRNLLVTLGETFFHGLQGDEDSLNSASDGVDKAFARDDPANAARDAMQGRYYIAYAWTARGTGYANTVTPEGLTQFNDRLEKAAGILEAAYLKHPDEASISRQMLTVELGQGQGADRMELWFGRTIKADPDDFRAYSAKAYYLSPEWHGSPDDLWNFGVECAKTQNWAAKIPMVLVDLTVSYLWKQHPETLTDDGKWAVLESTFRGYLEHYPKSTYYRSVFARWAVECAHWKVAREQFKILGDNWDPQVFPGSRYSEMKGLSDKNSP